MWLHTNVQRDVEGNVTGLLHFHVMPNAAIAMEPSFDSFQQLLICHLTAERIHSDLRRVPTAGPTKRRASALDGVAEFALDYSRIIICRNRALNIFRVAD